MFTPAKTQTGPALCSTVALGFLVLIASQPSSKASLLAYEGFNYTAGTSLNGQGAADSQWAGAWNVNSTSANNDLINSGSLVYVDSFGFGLVTSGNSAHATGNGTAVSQTTGVGDNTGGNTANAAPFRQFITSYGTSGAATTWISLIALRTGSQDVSIDAAPNNYAYGRAASAQFFYNSAATTARGNEMFSVGRGTQSSETDTSIPNDTWGVLQQGNANATKASTVNWASAPADFLLIRIDHVGSTVVDAINADTIHMWINPADLNNAPSDASANITINANDFNPALAINRDFVFNAFGLFGGSENASLGYGAMDFDELRVGTAFVDVTPNVVAAAVPEPTVLALAGLGAAALFYRRKKV